MFLYYLKLKVDKKFTKKSYNIKNLFDIIKVQNGGVILENNDSKIIKEIDRDSLNNATYIISYFSKNNKEVSFQHLNRLLYLLEAIYMAVTSDNYLYKDQFLAHNFELSNDEIIDKYKKFNNFPIELEEEDVTIPVINEIFINGLYKMFGEFSTSQLVSFTTRKNSAWDVINKEYNEKIPKNVVIEKERTKEWFSKLVKIEK